MNNVLTHHVAGPTEARGPMQLHRLKAGPVPVMSTSHEAGSRVLTPAGPRYLQLFGVKFFRVLDHSESILNSVTTFCPVIASPLHLFLLFVYSDVP